MPFYEDLLKYGQWLEEAYAALREKQKDNTPSDN
jgi:hypothetical protein